MFVTRNRSSKSWAMRPPTGRFGWGVPGQFVMPAAQQTYVLENTASRFVFKRDAVAGFRLVSMERVVAGQTVATWAQAETDLWSATVFDATQSDPLRTSVVMPDPRKMSVVSSTPAAITLKWSNQIIDGADAFDATMTLELRAGEDWLRAGISFAWAGTPTRFAIDTFKVLPLRFAPRDRGSDYAVIPNVTGIEIEDPIETLRYNPGDGRPLATFGNFVQNTWTYPTGRGAPLGMWGYYSRAAREGWMVWTERWDRTVMSITFQSDGANMTWLAAVPCEDAIVVGNGGRSIGITDFCLRPMPVGFHGWADFGDHYRRRLHAVAPPTVAQKRVDRADLSSIERGATVFLDSSQSLYTGATGPLVPLLARARAAVRPEGPPPAFVAIEPGKQNIYVPFEDEVGDLRGTLAAMFDQGMFGGIWQPGIIGPNIWDIHRWTGGDLRWWTQNLVHDSLRMSRNGALAGLGGDGLMEGNPGIYIHERTYPVTGWAPGSSTLSITGDPSADPAFVPQIIAVLIPASSSARLAHADVLTTANGSVVVSGNFIDGTGAVAIPQSGDQVALWSEGGGPLPVDAPAMAVDGYCPHALVNSSTLLAKLAENAVAGPFEIGRNCLAYWDVQTVPSIKQIFPTQIFCYRDHSSWPGIAGGYSRHPLGGGSWYTRAAHDLLLATRTAVRQRQFDLTGVVAFTQTTEDVDEQMLDVVDLCFHGNAAGDLWRVMKGIDPAIHKCKAVPLYSVVHSGAAFGRAINHELSTFALANSSHVSATPPRIDAVLHATMAYELAEWVYGYTLPTMSFWLDDVNGNGLDFFDDTQYEENGGNVSNTLRMLRDQWVQINRSLITFRDYIPNGRFLPPGVVDLEISDTTTGMVNSFYTGQYVSYDVLYPRSQFPRVLHSIHSSRSDSTMMVVLHNWTGVQARLRMDVSDALAAAGFTGAIALQMLDGGGDASDLGATLDPSTGTLEVGSMPPYGVAFLRLAAAVEAPAVPQTRETIRNAIVEILKGKTDAGQRVFANRIDAWEENSELPAIGVYNPTEESTLSLEAPFEYEREVPFIIEGVIEQKHRANGDDAIEILIRQIRNALMADEGARGTAARSWYTGQTTTMNSTGARTIFATKLRFIYRYYTRVDETPPDASLLRQLHADWGIGRAPGE